MFQQSVSIGFTQMGDAVVRIGLAHVATLRAPDLVRCLEQARLESAAQGKFITVVLEQEKLEAA